MQAECGLGRGRRAKRGYHAWPLAATLVDDAGDLPENPWGTRRTGAGPGGLGLIRQGQLVGALVAGFAALGCSSFRAAELYQSGSAALDAGEPRRAIAQLRAAEALAPEASEIQNHLGLAYREADQPLAARAAFERALELDCENRAARNNLRALDRLEESSGN